MTPLPCPQPVVPTPGPGTHFSPSSATGIHTPLRKAQQPPRRKPRMAIFASHRAHCVADLLKGYRNGELDCEIPLIISNHTELRSLAEDYAVAFRHVAVQPGHKRDAEALQLGLLRWHGVEFVVLARYMQILSAEFIRHYENRIINIHHSLLPAFAGARPYHRAYERGVKIIGATAHYVTEALDDGPIIEQDVIRVSHRDSVEDLMLKGANLEQAVLSRAVKWHIENRVQVRRNRTLVFDDEVNIAHSARDKAHRAQG